MKHKILLLALTLQVTFTFSQTLEIIPLGVYGGSDESNLSCYLIGIQNTNSYLSLDAGTLRSGINKSIDNEIFKVDSNTVLQNYIKGYFISHGHLDHLSGLIINSPEDSKKNIYALDHVIEVLQKNYFTNAAWANFANKGEAPILNKYTYITPEKEEFFSIENTSLEAKIYELSHVNPQKSSAILIKHEKQYVLYFGDTGADRVEQTTHLAEIWKDISPLIKTGELKTILIEVSFSNSQPETLLFGHLTPKLLQEELLKLAEFTGRDNLKGLNIIVTHLKPSGDAIQNIKQELESKNLLQVNYIYPQQGVKIEL